MLPSLRIPVTAPATKHQYVCLKLLAQHKQLIGGWSSLQQDRHQVKHQQRQNSSSVDVPLVYQQLDLAQGSEQRVLVGHLQQQVMQQELWVSLPAPGTYYVHVSCFVLAVTAIVLCSGILNVARGLTGRLARYCSLATMHWVQD